MLVLEELPSALVVRVGYGTTTAGILQSNRKHALSLLQPMKVSFSRRAIATCSSCDKLKSLKRLVFFNALNKLPLCLAPAVIVPYRTGPEREGKELECHV